jgi:hypothetical protein
MTNDKNIVLDILRINYDHHVYGRWMKVIVLPGANLWVWNMVLNLSKVDLVINHCWNVFWHIILPEKHRGMCSWWNLASVFCFTGGPLKDGSASLNTMRAHRRGLRGQGRHTWLRKATKSGLKQRGKATKSEFLGKKAIKLGSKQRSKATKSGFLRRCAQHRTTINYA